LKTAGAGRNDGFRTFSLGMPRVVGRLCRVGRGVRWVARRCGWAVLVLGRGVGLGRHGEEGLVDHHVSLGWVSSRKLLQPLHAHLGHEGEDDEEDGDVEDKVGDGDPVLQRGPVMGDHNPYVLQAGENRDNHPSHKEALVPSISPNNEEEGAENPKEGVENAVLDDRTDADVLALAVLLVDKL